MKTRNGSPTIFAFCCANSAYRAADAAGYLRLTYPESIRIVRLPCAGRIDSLHILKAFEKGADGVLVLGCHTEACHSLSGNIRAKNAAERAKALLEEAGINGNRIEVFTMAENQGHRFAQVANEAYERIKRLGPTYAK